jgi:hypothetical protein
MQRRKDFLIGQIARGPEEHQRVGWQTVHFSLLILQFLVLSSWFLVLRWDQSQTPNTKHQTQSNNQEQ